MEMTSASLPRVSVVGLGKLGAPLAAVLASRGFTVIGLDVSKTLVDALNAGKMPIVEPQLNELIANNRQRLSATMDAGEAVEKSDAVFARVQVRMKTKNNSLLAGMEFSDRQVYNA
jgi:UDPglucose 6-dehydrogenase